MLYESVLFSKREHFIIGEFSVKNYIILDGIEGCMRIYCTRHDDIHRAGTARWISSLQVQYILIQPEIKPSNIIIVI